MTQFLYTSAYVMRRAGRRSPTAGVQLHTDTSRRRTASWFLTEAASGWTLDQSRRSGRIPVTATS